jgi:aldose 1-epimerase
MEVVHYGTLAHPDGAGRREVEGVALESSALGLSVVTLGATLLEVTAPDRHGRHEPVCLAPRSLAELEAVAPGTYVGATCGRWAGRIGGGGYAVDGRAVTVAANEGTTQLHGGPDGFSARVWELVEATPEGDGGRVVFSLVSPAGDQGHPGTLHATTIYELEGPVLRIVHEARADAATACNLTNHAYWNLAGPAAWTVPGSIGDHRLRLDADRYQPTDTARLPRGPLAPVDGTPFDLRSPRALGEVLAELDAAGLELDTPFARRGGLDDPADGAGPEPTVVAELTHPGSGRRLEVRTDQPSIQAYGALHLGPPFAPRAALCLEAQRFPDAPNRPELGPALLRPGQPYRSVTELAFSVVP